MPARNKNGQSAKGVARSFPGQVTLWQEPGAGGEGVPPFRSGPVGRRDSRLIINVPKKSFWENAPIKGFERSNGR